MNNIKETINIALSIITVVLFVIAIVVFIDYGGNAVFYAVVVLAIALGFVNAWLISKSTETKRGAPQKMMRASARKGRRSTRRRR